MKIYNYQTGFTLVEVLVVVVVLSILAATVVVNGAGYRERSSDRERVADTKVIANRLERLYKLQAATVGPSYPATSVTAQGLANLIDDNDAVRAPEQSSSSIVMATSTSAQTPTPTQYIYQPFRSDNSLCTSGVCVRYRLYYRETLPPRGVKVINSMRQQ